MPITLTRISTNEPSSTDIRSPKTAQVGAVLSTPASKSSLMRPRPRVGALAGQVLQVFNDLLCDIRLRSTTSRACDT